MRKCPVPPACPRSVEDRSTVRRVGRWKKLVFLSNPGSTLALKFLQLLPGLLGVVAEDHDVILALIEIQTQSRLDFAFAGSIDRTCDVIDVDDHSPALRMGKLEEFHGFIASKKSGQQLKRLAAEGSR